MNLGVTAVMLWLSATILSRPLAQIPGCSREQAYRAEEESDRLKTWAAVYRAFHEFQACDDGAIAEGWAESIEQLLAHQWSKLPELQRLVSLDPKFGPFVLRHLGEITGDDNATLIRTYARQRCPGKSKVLCLEIAKALE